MTDQGPGSGLQAADVSRLVDQHGTRLLRFAALYLNDHHLAEDAVQEAFLKAAKSLHTFRGDSSELTWLTAITLNCCRSIRRRAWYRLQQQSVPLDSLPLAAEDVKPDNTVLEAVLGLPPKYKEIILLYYYQALPLKDIGQMLNQNISTLSTRLKRARQKLKEQLEGWYFDGE